MRTLLQHENELGRERGRDFSFTSIEFWLSTEREKQNFGKIPIQNRLTDIEKEKTEWKSEFTT